MNCPFMPILKPVATSCGHGHYDRDRRRTPNVTHAADVVTLDLTPAEAVILDSFLRRFSESDTLTTEHPSESQCLWNVECLLERNADRPARPSIAAARNELSPDEE